MTSIPVVVRFGLVLAALSTSLSAGDWTENFDLKLRTGLTSGTLMKDSSDNKAFGVGVGTTYSLGEGKDLTIDFGYDYLPGRGEDVMPRQGPIYFNAGGTIISSVDGAPLFLQVNDSMGSADSRKRSAEGFGLRVGYRQAIPAVKDLAWQAGISLDRYRSSNQFVGNAVPVYLGGTDGKTITPVQVDDGYEGWAYSRQRTTFTPGFYVGLAYQLHENHKLEFNVRNVGVGYMEYHPLAYTGKPAAFANKDSRGFVYELTLTVKL